MAINCLVSQPNVVTLSKMRNIEHIEENVGPVGWQMDKEDIERLRKDFPNQQNVSDTVAPIYTNRSFLLRFDSAFVISFFQFYESRAKTRKTLPSSLGRGCSYRDGLLAAKSSVKLESIALALRGRRPKRWREGP